EIQASPRPASGLLLCSLRNYDHSALILYSAAGQPETHVTARTLSVPAGRSRVLAALFAFLLAGCGRMGPLEPPPDASAVAKPAQTAEEATLNPQVKPKIPPVTAPKQAFILDPLLK